MIAWIAAWSTSAIEIDARRCPSAIRTVADEGRQLRGVDPQVALRVADLHLDRVLRVAPIHHRLPASVESISCRIHAVRCSGYLTRPW